MVYLKCILASLLGIPEPNPEINALVNSITKNNLFTISSSFDSVAQDAHNPFLGSGIKMEVQEPEPFFNRSTESSEEIED